MATSARRAVASVGHGGHLGPLLLFRTVVAIGALERWLLSGGLDGGCYRGAWGALLSPPCAKGIGGRITRNKIGAERQMGGPPRGPPSTNRHRKSHHAQHSRRTTCR